MATKWLTFDSVTNEPMLVAPAELALAWPGSKPTGELDGKVKGKGTSHGTWKKTRWLRALKS